MLGDFGFGEVQVHLHALVEQFRRLGGVAEEQLGHYAVGGEFVEVTAAEVGELVVVRGLHSFDSFVELRVHGLSAGLEALVFGGHFARFQFLEHLAVGAGGDVRERGNGLQLRRAFVNGGDACIAVEALAGVFKHVAGTAVHLDAVVGVQVGVFGVHTLRKRRASRSEFLIELEFSLLLVGELAGALDVLEALVEVHVAGCLVQECAACVEACLDVRNHFIDGGEVHDGLAELLAVLGVGESFVVLGIHCLGAGLECFVIRSHFAVFQFFKNLAVGTGGDVRESGHGLQLRRTFVNRSDASVAVEALAGVFEHVAGTAVHLDAVVGVQVGVFGVHAVTRPFGLRLTLASAPA